MAFTGVTEELEKHPLWIALAVVAVALLAFVQRGSSSGQQDYTFAGGGRAAPIDPEAAAIEEASIAAQSQNLSTIAGLIGLKDSNATALQGSLAQTSASRDIGLSQISAGRDVGLAEVAANEEIANARTSADLYATENTNAANITAAQITAGVQRAINDSQAARDQAAIAAGERVALYQSEVNKAIARGEDNTSIVSGFFNLAGEIAGAGKSLLGFIGL